MLKYKIEILLKVNKYYIYCITTIFNMSAINYITSIPVFQGVQGKFYIVDGMKYHICFPIQWALRHKTFRVGKYHQTTGPVECGNCREYSSVRGVFIGYCANCLENYLKSNDWRGNMWPQQIQSVDTLADRDMWNIYPWMFNVKISEIGDKLEEEEEQEEEEQVFEEEEADEEPYDRADWDTIGKALHQEHCNEINRDYEKMHNEYRATLRKIEDSSDNDDSLPSEWEENGEWMPVTEEIQTSSTNTQIQWISEVGLVDFKEIEKLPLRRQEAMTDEEISNLSNL
jgi:hypothetical protein